MSLRLIKTNVLFFLQCVLPRPPRLSSRWRAGFSDKGVKLIPACFLVPEFGNSPESRRAGRWRAGLLFVSLAQTWLS